MSDYEVQMLALVSEALGYVKAAAWGIAFLVGGRIWDAIMRGIKSRELF